MLKGAIFSEEHKRKLSIARRNRPAPSAETRLKMSISGKKAPNTGRFNMGHISWSQGLTAKDAPQMSNAGAKKGERRAPQSEFKVGNKSALGHTVSAESRKLMGLHSIGVSPLNKGKPNYKVRGANSNFWKGGVSKINRSERANIMGTLEYKNWRRAVFERDNFTCVWCNRKGIYLNADHIKPFAYFPELRFDISNGRTLCVDCHKKTPSWGFKGIARAERGAYL